MDDLKPTVNTEGSSVTVIVGASNCAISDQKDAALTYSSMSYTVGAISEVGDYEPQGVPSRPLNPDAVGVLDSVLQAHGNEANVLRDIDGDF